MVSLGDTTISLHILHLNSECQDLPKFKWGGGCSVVVKSQSAKICLNFNRGEGCSAVVKTQSAKIWPTFHFRVGGEFCSSQSQSEKFNCRGGGGCSVVVKSQNDQSEWRALHTPCHSTGRIQAKISVVIYFLLKNIRIILCTKNRVFE